MFQFYRTKQWCVCFCVFFYRFHFRLYISQIIIWFFIFLSKQFLLHLKLFQFLIGFSWNEFSFLVFFQFRFSFFDTILYKILLFRFTIVADVLILYLNFTRTWLHFLPNSVHSTVKCSVLLQIHHKNLMSVFFSRRAPGTTVSSHFSFHLRVFVAIWTLQSDLRQKLWNIGLRTAFKCPSDKDMRHRIELKKKF